MILQTRLVKKLTEEMSAADWSREMTRLFRIKPSSIKKMFGTNGPTPEQKVKYDADVRAWNAAYRKASAMQKKQLAIDNAAFHAKHKVTVKDLSERIPRTLIGNIKKIYDNAQTSSYGNEHEAHEHAVESAWHYAAEHVQLVKDNENVDQVYPVFEEWLSSVM